MLFRQVTDGLLVWGIRIGWIKQCLDV